MSEYKPLTNDALKGEYTKEYIGKLEEQCRRANHLYNAASFFQYTPYLGWRVGEREAALDKLLKAIKYYIGTSDNPS